jgi:hypothetical protein
MNDDQFRDLTREFLQQLADGFDAEPVASSELLTEQPWEPIPQDELDQGAAPSRGQAVRQSWDQLMAVLEQAATMARNFNKLNDLEGVGEPAVEETGFGGSEANDMSMLLQNIWEGAGFHADEIFKGYRH